MRRPARQHVALAGLLLASTLAGCVSDPYNERRPAPPRADTVPADRAPAAEPGPPEPPPVADRPAPTEREALRRFALAYANWEFESLAHTRSQLVAQATGALRAQLAQEGRDAAAEASRRASTVRNSGSVAGILVEPGEPSYVIMREAAWSGDELQQSVWLLYRAEAVETPDGWLVSRWEALN